MDYKVISVSKEYESDAVEQLEREVIQYILKGWKPLGRVSVSRISFKNYFMAQAMIKE